MTRSAHSAAGAQDAEDIPTWDTTPISMRSWLRKLPSYCEGINDNYVSWWEQGYTMSKDTVLAPTTYHPFRLHPVRLPGSW